MSVEVAVGDQVRLDLTLSGDDDYLARADGEVGEVVPSDSGEHTHLVEVDLGDETLEILVADHELQPVTEVEA